MAKIKRPRNLPPKIRVTLSENDRQYRQKCIDQELEFTPSFLVETRAQRRGITERELRAMVSYELNLELADEAVLMRLTTWATDPAAWIDWQSINARAAANGASLAKDFADFRKLRQEQLRSAINPNKRG